MEAHPPFNDYVDGFRINKNGNRSSLIGDLNLVKNLRFAFGSIIESLSDAALVNAYNDFVYDESFGNNDENFIEFLRDTGEL